MKQPAMSVFGMATFIAAVATSSCGGGATTESITSVTPPIVNVKDSVVPTGYYLRWVTDNGVRYPYQVFIPVGYTSTKKWPVVVFLHGGNDVGSDGYLQLRVGLGPYINAHAATFPAIAVFPQMSSAGNGVGRAAYIRTVMSSLDSTMKEFSGGDSLRVYMTGLSFGGIQGFEIAWRNPTRFAAFVPISAFLCNSCITGDPKLPNSVAYDSFGRVLPNLPYWQFQGAMDQVIPTDEVRAFVAAYKAVNSRAKYTEYPSGDHNSTYGMAYATQALWDWLWAQHQ